MIAMLMGSMTAAVSPAHAGPEPFIGEVMAVPYNFCPRSFMEADGRLLKISEYTALFSLLGTQYGGDGRTTFGLPDLRGKLVSGADNNSAKPVRYCIAVQGIFPSRS